MLPNQTYTPEDILRIVRRRWWVVALPLVVASISMFLVGRTLPNMYRSETVILVVPQRIPESYVRSTVTARIEDRLSTIKEQILSRSRLERIITDFDLYHEERRTRPMEEIVARMRPDIHIFIEREDSFRVSHDNRDPVLAQKVTERLASLFIDENSRDREVWADGTSQFLDSQLEEAKQRLVEHERRLEAYRTQHAGELPTQVESNLQVMQSVQLQLQTATDATNRDKDRRAILERELLALENSPAAAPARGGDPQDPNDSGSPAQQLEAAQARLSALQQRYKPEHPDVQAAQRTVRDLEAKAQAEAASRPAARPVARPLSGAEVTRQNQVRGLRDQITDVDTQIARREADVQRLRSTLNGYQSKVDAAPRREAELTELTRDYGTLHAAYTSLLAKHEESKIAANLEKRQVGEQFKVLDPPRVPQQPFSPNRLRLNGMGAVGGLVIGLALVFVLEYRDRSIKTAVDFVRVLDLPVLALIPLMQSEREAQARRRHRRLLTLTGIGVAGTGSAVLYLLWTLRVF